MLAVAAEAVLAMTRQRVGLHATKNEARKSVILGVVMQNRQLPDAKGLMNTDIENRMKELRSIPKPP